MKELLDKLSSYNIFNYLFPGVLFTLILTKISGYNFIQKDLIIGAFFYYFVGLVISRVGSLFIEPFFKKVSFLKFADYGKFVSASKVDSKIELFSEINNMYRTLCSMLFLLFFFKLYEGIASNFAFLKDWGSEILVVTLLILFLFSYRKQTNYITKRIEANAKSDTLKDD